MQEIQIKAMQTYEKNLNYFVTNEPKLLKKIQMFDIQELALKPKYELQYKDGYFDVIELSSGSFLYGRDSNEYAKEVAKDVNYDKTTSLFEGMQDWITTQEDLKHIKKLREDESNRLNDVFMIMHEAMKIAPRTTLMKEIDKFIFIGTGLGTHIVEIHNKIHASEYLIIEDDIELFRLSLFVTPYYELAQNATLKISVAEDDNLFLVTMTHFLEGSFYNNRYLKYFKFPAHSDEKIKVMQTSLGSQGHHIFPYGVRLEKSLRPLRRISNGYKTLNISQKFSENIFEKNPALIIASGPSFKKNIDWVKEHAKNFIIIAVSSSLKTLQKNGIKPDIVTHIDGFDDVGNSCMPLFDGIDIDGFLKDTIFILGSHSPDALLKILNKKNIYFIDDSTKYYDNFGSLSASCVGSYSTVLAIKLGFKNSYLLGLDLALDQISGATHSDEHFLNTTQDLSRANKLEHTISLRNNIVPIKGNFKPIVYTLPEFVRSVQTLCSFIPILKDDTQTIYNLNDGAFLKGTVAIQVADIKNFVPIDKTMFNTQISAIFETHSQIFMNKDDLESMERRLQNAKTVLATIEQYRQKEYTNENRYMYDLLGVVGDILKFKGKEADSLTGVFSLFFQYTIPYIVDIMNTQKITKIMTHMKKIDSELIDGMLNIVNRYINEMELFLKNMKK